MKKSDYPETLGTPLNALLVSALLFASVTGNSCFLKSAPDSTLPSQITLSAVAVRDAENGTVIEGKTNLPPGTRLGVELVNGKRVSAPDLRVNVDSGKFRSAPFFQNNAPLPRGKLKVHVFTQFNSDWQSAELLALLGQGGKNLKPSGVIHPEDAQLTDSDNVLDYTAELVIPPIDAAALKRAAAAQAEAANREKAVEMVKKAFIVVNGSRSSTNVEDGVQIYCKASNFRIGDGWSATSIGKDTYNVGLDLVKIEHNVGRRDSAMWEVNFATRKVLYRNKTAKSISLVHNK